MGVHEKININVVLHLLGEHVEVSEQEGGRRVVQGAAVLPAVPADHEEGVHLGRFRAAAGDRGPGR